MSAQTISGEIKGKKIKQDGCSVVYSVEAPVASVNTAFQEALVQVQAHVHLPGFRKGKAPIDLVKKNFQDAVKERALDNIVRTAVGSVIQNEKLNPVTSPLLKKVKFDENKPLEMEVEFEIPPVFEPKNYTGAKVSKKSTKVDDKAVNDAIEDVRGHNARLEAAEDGAALSEEHFAIVDYTAYNKDGGEIPGSKSAGELVDMSAPQTIAGLSESIKGAKKGDSREFKTKIGNGEEVSFKVTVSEVKKKVLPPLDDAFAKQMGFNTVDEFRNHVRQALERNITEQSERDVVRQIEDHLVAQNPIQLPPSLVEHHINLSVGRLMERFAPGRAESMTEEERKGLKDKLRPAVERDVRLGYVLNAVAKKENLFATDADLNEELDKSVAKAVTDEERQKIRRFFEARRDDIAAGVTERKVLDFLKSKSEIKEAK